MRSLFFLFVGLCACSNGSQQSTDAGNGNDGSTNDATSDDGGDGAAGEYCPAGYTLTPFLSDTATTHKFSKADQVADPNKDYVAVLETDAGRVVWHFHQSTAPLATNSFIFLALHHYFDGIAFHRVITNVIAQGGDPKTLQPNGGANVWGTGGPGYAFADELTPTPVYSALTVAMANSGPNTNGSQFFINMTDNSSNFQPLYTLFADVIEGSDTLPKIATSPDSQGLTPPATPTVMTDVHICEK